MILPMITERSWVTCRSIYWI